jgi:hypothetical protein
MSLLVWNIKLHVSHNGNENIIQFCEMQFVPHHGSNKSGFLLDLRASYKCNESTLKVKDNGDPTWCVTER